MTDEQEATGSLAELNELRRAGALSADQYLQLMQQCRDEDYWRTWAMRALLVLGAVHLLAGVIFFFAYNWADLSSFARFGVLQVAIIGSFAAALLMGFEKASGQAMLIVASVFTGVLLAVIGQTYQTGADAWELFVAWTVLILPWTMASKNSAHWFLWVILFITAYSLYGQQVMLPLGRISDDLLPVAIGLLPAAFLAVRELAIRSGLRWLDDDWFRRSLVVMSVGTLFFPALWYVFGGDEGFIGFVAFVSVSFLLVWIYMTLLPDFPVVAIVVGLVTLVGMAIGGRLIHEIVDFDGGAGSLVFALLLLGGWCAMLTTGAVKILTAWNRKMRGGAGIE